jgi:hypothetical protein
MPDHKILLLLQEKTQELVSFFAKLLDRRIPTGVISGL